MIRRGVVTLTVGLAVVLAACGSSSAGGSTAVTIRASDGTTTTLAAFHGTPLIVNLWATWCHPCVAEMPALQQVASGLSGATVIGVNIGDDPTAAADFARKLGVTYPQFTDPDGNLETALGVSGLPATAFVDANGKVLSVHTGAFTAASFTAAIHQTFGGTTNA